MFLLFQTILIIIHTVLADGHFQAHYIILALYRSRGPAGAAAAARAVIALGERHTK